MPDRQPGNQKALGKTCKQKLLIKSGWDNPPQVAFHGKNLKKHMQVLKNQSYQEETTVSNTLQKNEKSKSKP